MRKTRGRKPKVPRDHDDDSDGGGRSGIRSLVVGLALLRTMAERGTPLPLGEIAEESGLSPSRAHRYVTSLVELGFLEQDDASRYALGQSSLRLGLLALEQLQPVRIGVQALLKITDGTGLDGHLAVWGPHGPTIIRWNSGRQGHQIRFDEGRVVPILWTATGRILMAYKPFDEVRAVLDPEIVAWNRDHPDRPIDDTQLLELCEAVRQQGISYSLPDPPVSTPDTELVLAPAFLRQFRISWTTLSVPIFDHVGRIAMALTLFAPDHIKLRGGSVDYEAQLRAAARNASDRLGAPDKQD